AEDVQIVATIAAQGGLGMRLYRPADAPPDVLRFKLFTRDEAIVLSHSMPMLERMGLVVLEERPYRIAPAQAGQPRASSSVGADSASHDVQESGADHEAPRRADGPVVWIDDFAFRLTNEVDVGEVRERFEDAFAQVYAGTVENDEFNRLVLAAGLSAREVMVLRAYAKYMRQIGFALSQAYIETTLAHHPGIARMLVVLFALRFDPIQAADEADATQQARLIEEALENVATLSEDRVLRLYLALIRATTRTNYWRCDATGRPRGFLSFKFDPARVPDLPAPRPMYEIFVYSPRFEGVHLRGGKVARGGLRWSDRPEDFRTEVLGLVKAQMVKNAVIVPGGSKGGFVVKRVSPSEREAYATEGLECYRDFLRGLLDLTDNLVSGQIVSPMSVRRHDEDDPYLVVAADKGTARFSDHANEVAKEYRFWLDDAFASGGSAGYDHKAMGITARGAWESVKRHFREMGIDTQSTAFTVAGIGDMSGDVFGNGMLRSRHIKLVAAFDHRHIFIDPDPDAEISYVERERLFRLPRSSWADYNAELISQGGGVWPRSAKTIALSPEAIRLLALDAADDGTLNLAPNELVAAILRAPVDLLYNGGIGTYVKASAETHAEVGDRANDPVRVNGGDLRSKVVGEGGNLGFTQRGRIEYALRGGRINTDAIDNSGGVDASDHEVNIKILLGIAIADGVLSEANRNALLAGMTDEVAQLVLRDNYFQNQALSLMAREGVRGLDAQERLIIALEKAGRLDRAIEYLPDAETIALRRAQGVGLTRPELAVLFAYAKMWLYDEVVASPLPDDPWVETALARYFPTPLHEVYASCMVRHPLRREIVATYVVNSMINRVGSTFVHQQQDATGMQAHEVVRAYLLARESFGAVELWHSIEALDNQVSVDVQARMAGDLHGVLVRATTWFLRSPYLTQPMAVVIERFAAGVNAMCARLRDIVDSTAVAALDADAQTFIDAGVPAPLAQSVASHARLYSALGITEVAGESQRPPELVARVLFALSAHMGLDGLGAQINALPEDGFWQVRAKHALRDDLSALQRAVVLQALAAGDANDAESVVQAWTERAASRIEPALKLLQELRAAPPDLAMLSVALRELRKLV
ncbi:MAG TPA: NAD-glutamate dehydrogenase domain-containing protein, partial [Burkholderiales bacterium]